MNNRNAQPDTTTRADKNRRGGVGACELRLTSMLDVCFLLLIFFVLTANFSMGEGILSSQLPSGPPPAVVEQPEMPVEIALHSLGDNQVSIQIIGSGEAVASITELRRLLVERRQRPNNPQGIYAADDPVVIQSDGTVAWSHVVGVFDAASSADFENIHFASAR